MRRPRRRVNNKNNIDNDIPETMTEIDGYLLVIMASYLTDNAQSIREMAKRYYEAFKVKSQHHSRVAGFNAIATARDPFTIIRNTEKMIYNIIEKGLA